MVLSQGNVPLAYSIRHYCDPTKRKKDQLLQDILSICDSGSGVRVMVISGLPLSARANRGLLVSSQPAHLCPLQGNTAGQTGPS